MTSCPVITPGINGPLPGRDRAKKNLYKYSRSLWLIKVKQQKKKIFGIWAYGFLDRSLAYSPWPKENAR